LRSAGKTDGENVKIRFKTLALIGGCSLLLALGSLADVIPTNEWVNFKGDVTFNGQPAPIGSIIDAYDPTGIHCGTFTVGDVIDSVGIYGFLLVYRDDHTAPDTIDEGAEPNDSISFKVNGREAIEVGDVVWGANGDIDTVDLSATGIIDITGVDLPGDTTGAPEDTMRFWVGVRNDGDGLDFYGVTSTSARGWQTVNQDTFTYADSGEIANVYFDLIIPTWPGDIPDTITFSVFSYLDTTKHVDGNIELTISISDVGEEPFSELPSGFHLNQNYPNPFNPTTTFSFTLSSQTTINLQIFNVLGQQVDARNLGPLPSGSHSVEYNACGLPSGVYFYRLETELGSQTKKMILLK